MSRKYIAHPRYIRASETLHSDYINILTTGTSYYDAFLNAKDLAYMQSSKNRTGQIVLMSPQEYYEECAHKIFNSSVSSLMKQRQHDQKSIEWLSDYLDSGHKFDLPYLNYADHGQEGLHRMLVLGDKFGWFKKYPVLVVDFANKRQDEVSQARKALRHAISKATEYAYTEDSLPSALQEEIEWQLDSQELDYKSILYNETADSYVFSIEGFEDDLVEEVFKSDLRIREDDLEDDLLIDDDFDINDLGPDLASLFFK